MNKTDLLKYIELEMITSLTSILKKYPLLEALIKESQLENPVAAWDLCMTVAGALLFQLRSSEISRDDLIKLLNAKDPMMETALQDLVGFIATADSIENISQIIGTWVLLNVKGEKLTDLEILELVPVVGRYLDFAVFMVNKSLEN